VFGRDLAATREVIPNRTICAFPISTRSGVETVGIRCHRGEFGDQHVRDRCSSYRSSTLSPNFRQQRAGHP
jgi:hypothetical protein